VAHCTDMRLGLTHREFEIVELICGGLTNSQIAERLNIGVATVKTHLLHVFEKLGVKTRAALVARFLAATHRLRT
jgi:DNA-binding CsgD family transcriptional regulator